MDLIPTMPATWTMLSMWTQAPVAVTAPAGSQTRDVLLSVLSERDRGLGEHVASVAELAGRMGRSMGLEDEQLQHLRRAAELHDVGKIAIPDSILFKPGPLDDSEWEYMRRHTVIGERILLSAPSLEPVAKLVRSSHERVDGTGYPDNLSGEDIPLGARIVAVCDAFDAMVGDRPYQEAKSPEQAVEELKRCAGSQFDRAVVDTFEKVIAAVPTPVPRFDQLDSWPAGADVVGAVG